MVNRGNPIIWQMRHQRLPAHPNGAFPTDGGAHHEGCALSGCHSPSQSVTVSPCSNDPEGKQERRREGNNRGCGCALLELRLRDSGSGGATRDAPKHFASRRPPPPARAESEATLPVVDRSRVRYVAAPPPLIDKPIISIIIIISTHAAVDLPSIIRRFILHWPEKRRSHNDHFPPRCLATPTPRRCLL